MINPVNGEKITRSLVDANTFPMIAYDLDPGVNNNDSNHIRNKIILVRHKVYGFRLFKEIMENFTTFILELVGSRQAQWRD